MLHFSPWGRTAVKVSEDTLGGPGYWCCQRSQCISLAQKRSLWWWPLKLIQPFLMATALWRCRWLCAAPLVRPGNECWQSHCALNVCWTQWGRVWCHRSARVVSRVWRPVSFSHWTVICIVFDLETLKYIFNHVGENAITYKSEYKYLCLIPANWKNSILFNFIDVVPFKIKMVVLYKIRNQEPKPPWRPTGKLPFNRKKSLAGPGLWGRTMVSLETLVSMM